MRKSVESLCGIVRTSHMNPLNGDAHVFSQQITLLNENASRISSGRMTFNSFSYGSQVSLFFAIIQRYETILPFHGEKTCHEMERL